MIDINGKNKFQHPASDAGHSIAVDSSGNVFVIASSYQGSINFGGGNLTSKGFYDIFVASFTNSGVHRWSKSFGGTSSDGGHNVAVDSSGNVFVTGYYHGSVDLGGGTLASKGSYDIFVASLTTSGLHRWSNSFGGQSRDLSYGIAIDSSGNVFVTGIYEGTANFGSGNTTSKGDFDIFLIKLAHP